MGGPAVFGFPLWASNSGPVSWFEIGGAAVFVVAVLVVAMLTVVIVLRLIKFALTGDTRF